jgi:hypothetical protein
MESTDVENEAPDEGLKASASGSLSGQSSTGGEPVMEKKHIQNS